jgi:hypothetical protein
VTLDELCDRATLVALVEPAEPPSTSHELPISEPTWNDEPAPPYVRRIQHYVVLRVLKGDAVVGTRLDVDTADWRRGQRLHRDYHIKGLSRHTMQDAYEPKHPLGDGDRARIIFVQPGDGEDLEFVAWGAAEAERCLDTVVRALKRR